MNTLRSHKSAINSIVYSPDGKRIISGGEDSSIIFWNLHGERPDETGHCYRLMGHKGPVSCISYAPNGQFFASASQDSTVNIWQLKTHTESLVVPSEKAITYHCHTSPIRAVDISPDSRTFCTGSNDKTVKVYDANHINKFLFTLQGHTNWVRAVKYSPASTGGHLIASTGDDGMILVHDTRCNPNNFAIHEISGSRSKLSARTPHFNSLEWYPLSDFMIGVGSSDSSVRLYDTRKGQMIQYYQSHTGAVRSTSFHPSGKFLMSAGVDSLIKIYDLLEGRVLFTIEAHKYQVNCVSFNQTGTNFATVGNDRTVYLWNSNLITEGLPLAALKPLDEEDVPLSNGKHTTFSRVHPPITLSPEATPRISRSSTHTRLSTSRPDIFSCNDNLTTNRTARSCFSTPALSRLEDLRGHSAPASGLLNHKQPLSMSASQSTVSSSVSPSQLQLLNVIIDQISDLATAVSQIEERLSAVENAVTKNV